MNIQKKNSRRYVKPSSKLYTEELQRGLHLGWRKNSEVHTSWTARRYNGTKMEFRVLALADDHATADGTTVMTYDQAVAAAYAWHQERTMQDNGQVDTRPYTVEQAGKAWLAAWEGSPASKRNADGTLKHHILPTFGSIRVDRLRREQVQEWLLELAKKPPLKSLAKKSKTKFDPNDPETMRKRRDTANRIFNDLSALLTLAYDNGKVASKAAWETVKKFENVGIAKNEYLTLEEAKRFIEVCPQDFRDLVQAALITGCRYMESARLKVSNYDQQNRSISLIQGKTKKLKHVFLTTDEAAFFDTAVSGKQDNDLIFIQEDGSPWRKSNQQPRMKAALKAAGINRHIRYHDLRHTFGTLLAMNGTSLNLIANQLGHSSVRTTERFYAHFSPSYIADEIRANKPKLF